MIRCHNTIFVDIVYCIPGGVIKVAMELRLRFNSESTMLIVMIIFMVKENALDYI